MADEAFALSPISARSASPTDADYDAISEAFMETARGRWFLGEYAKRNRNADTAMVLEAVTRLEQSLAESRAEAAATKPPADGGPAAVEGILASVKMILEQTRASLVVALSEADIGPALSAFQRSARIIQEIAWGLRESGSDGRICTMLDTQVRAMTAACETFGAAEHRDAVLHAFDASLMQIGKLAVCDPAETSGEIDLLQSDSGNCAVTTAESRPLETTIVATDEAATDAAAPPLDVEAVQTTIAIEAAEPPSSVAEEKVPAPSLGDSLIAHGIVTPEAHVKPDPLAPIRRMSQAQKIAFFS